MKPLGALLSADEWAAFEGEVACIQNLCKTTPDYFAAAYTYLRAVATINDIFRHDPGVEYDFVKSDIITRTKAVEELGYVMYAALTKGKDQAEEPKAQ